jgi:glycosyltransferase involved in cell wall biosynthesis
VIHIHWIHPYFLLGTAELPYRVPGTRLISAVSAAIFILQIKVAHRFVNRLVWTVHNLSNHEDRYSNLDRWVGMRLANQADVLQVWDESTKTEAAEFFRIPSSKLAIVPHGDYLELARNTVCPTRSEAHDSLGISGYDRVFLYFGMIRPYKQVPMLIKTFSKLSIDNACLIVAGNPTQNDLEKRVRELGDSDPNVRLDLRHIPDSEIPTMFAAADFAVLPYKNVFNSGAAVLAMTLSTPVVAPHMGSLPGVLPTGNILYNRLECGLRRANQIDGAKIISVGQQNREAIESGHDWRKISKEILELYGNN